MNTSTLPIYSLISVWTRRRVIFVGDHIISEAHAAFYVMGTGVLSQWYNSQVVVDHSPPSNAEVQNEDSYTCTPPVCLHGMEETTVHFYLYTFQELPVLHW
jgi:hypothetical protein